MRAFVIWVVVASFAGSLVSAANADAAEPVPFASASAPCSAGQVSFPIQSSAHSNVIYFFRSVGAVGDITGSEPFLGRASFGEGDEGWVGGGEEVRVGAGTAPTMSFNCTGGSLEVVLAERPGTPATFSGATTYQTELAFKAPGSGQYVVNVTMLQGAIEIEGVGGIIQSSGEYPVGSLRAGNAFLRVEPQAGPQAIWTATVREAPVSINGLSFPAACIAPGSGVSATFSVTGQTTLSANVTNVAGQLVRGLGTFAQEEGKGSIPWDGRGAAGGAVTSGSYTLNLVSMDPQGDQTTAQAGVYVDSTGPSVNLNSPSVILPGESPSFQISDPGCGVQSAVISVEEKGAEKEVVEQSFGLSAVGKSLPSSGLVSVSPDPEWNPGRYVWAAKVTSKAGATRTVTGALRVVKSLPPTACVVPRVSGRTLVAAKKLLRVHGCLVGRIIHRPSGKTRPGRVIESRPHVRTRKRLHAKVALVVAKQPSDTFHARNS